MNLSDNYCKGHHTGMRIDGHTPAAPRLRFEECPPTLREYKGHLRVSLLQSLPATIRVRALHEVDDSQTADCKEIIGLRVEMCGSWRTRITSKADVVCKTTRIRRKRKINFGALESVVEDSKERRIR